MSKYRMGEERDSPRNCQKFSHDKVVSVEESEFVVVRQTHRAESRLNKGDNSKVVENRFAINRPEDDCRYAND